MLTASGQPANESPDASRDLAFEAWLRGPLLDTPPPPPSPSAITQGAATPTRLVFRNHRLAEDVVTPPPSVGYVIPLLAGDLPAPPPAINREEVTPVLVFRDLASPLEVPALISNGHIGLSIIAPAPGHALG